MRTYTITSSFQTGNLEVCQRDQWLDSTRLARVIFMKIAATGTICVLYAASEGRKLRLPSTASDCRATRKLFSRSASSSIYTI